MTPFQIGFLTSRLVAVFCSLQAVSRLAYLLYLFKALPQMTSGGYSGGGLTLEYEIASVLPFAVESMLAVVLWVKAEWTARLFVPEPLGGQKAAGSGDLGASLFRALGVYFVAVSGPALVQATYMIISSTNESLTSQPMQAILNGRIRTDVLADLVQFLIGVVLLVGARRMGRAALALPGKYWAATSLPDDTEPPQ